MKPIYVAAYQQSRFGKLMGATVPEIIRAAAEETCRSVKANCSAVDVATIGAVCNLTLNEQGLLSGLLAMTPGLEAKPIESVENACATGGQAILAVSSKLMLGEGDVGLAVGFEKMRDAEGKMDGRLVGKVLGLYSHPDERPGKTFVFPHLFAEVMRAYMDEWGVAEEDLTAIAVAEYEQARKNPFAQMQRNDVTLEAAMRIEGINRYVVEGLPLKTYDASQISDGWAGMLLATEEGLEKLGVVKADCVRLAGWGQATDPLKKEGRDVLRPKAANAAMAAAYRRADLAPADVNVAEVHDCFSVMGAIGAEVIGRAEPGKGARFWREGKARIEGECAINTSGGLIAKGHPIGATGIAMVGWCAWQLLGKVPKELQVPNARAAATFNIGGPLCASVCTVLTPAT